MKINIILKNTPIEYIVRTNKRAKRIRITVYPGGGIAVTKPRFVSLRKIENFIRSNAKWIIKNIERNKSYSNSSALKGTRRDYLENKEKSRKIIEERIAHFNKFYKFKFNQISIRNQSTRWGSCSTKKNLNFNYRVALLPQHLSNYIIVHEICHLKELNHSLRFWKLVSQTISNYKSLRRELKKRNFVIS